MNPVFLESGANQMGSMISQYRDEQMSFNLTSPYSSATNLRNSPVAIFGPFFSGAMDGEIYRIGWSWFRVV